jgi:hypothetical protein
MSGSELDECPICLEEYDDDNPKYHLQCDHYFHRECIGKCFEDMSRKNIRCPVCRSVEPNTISQNDVEYADLYIPAEFLRELEIVYVHERDNYPPLHVDYSNRSVQRNRNIHRYYPCKMDWCGLFCLVLVIVFIVGSFSYNKIQNSHT